MYPSQDRFRRTTSAPILFSSLLSTDPTTAGQLSALAKFLAGRHEAILQAWKVRVDGDSELQTASTLSLLHFENRVPEILEAFENRLRVGETPRQERETHTRLEEHALHRWKHGYSLRDVVREWSHLQVCVLRELESYAFAHPELAPGVMPAAREAWTLHCGEAVCESAAEYSQLHQAEAAGHLRDLQQALESIRQLERQRAEAWHEAAHDLRGNVGLVTTSTSILTEEGVPVALRTRALGLLQNSVTSLHQLLEDLMSLARLESGREEKNVAPFDAAALLLELCSTLEPLAEERGLFFRCQGPRALPVEGDAAKVRRIVQNLALNALRYTPSGGVVVTWGETWESDAERWRIRIEDTGPGFPSTPLGRQLQKATRQGRQLEEERPGLGAEPIPASDPAAAVSGPLPLPGEGIGLSIVKRLCELLDAGLEIASTEQGTTVQVVLPRRYPSEA